MAIKKRPQLHKSKGHIVTNKNNKERVLEKIILALFLVFVIIVTMILFKVPTSQIQTPTTSKAIASIQLDKTQYNASERIKGVITLQMEQLDVLPKETKFQISISTNVPDCQLKYVCPNGVTIDWHNYTDGQCVEIEPDPEGKCCFLMGPACIQLILNSKFNAPLRFPNWMTIPYGTNPTAIGVEDLIDPISGNITLEKALFLDSTDVAYTIPNVTATVSQPLGTRQFAVKDLVPSSTRIYVQGPIMVKKGNYSIYNATMYICYNATTCYTGGIPVNATYSWTNLNNSVGILNATTEKVVKFNATEKGTTTITVTATYEGKTATRYIFVCVYNVSLHECTGQTIEEKTESKNIVPELKFDSYQQNQQQNQPKEVYFQAQLPVQPSPQPVPGQRGLIRWTLAYTTITPIIQSQGCAFEIVVKGVDSINTTATRNLHFWYKVPTSPNSCNKPSNTSTDKYISMSPPPQNNVSNYSIDLYSAWIQAGWNVTDIITEVTLVSYGVLDQNNQIHGQRVYFDNVELRKYGTEPSLNCTSRGKNCCVKGAGLGNYLGDQFICPEDLACYDRCTPSLVRNFEGFKALSSTPSKFNKTTEKCRVIIEGREIDLIDYCYPQGIPPNPILAGEGYTACIDTGNTSSTPLNCRGWDNTYVIDLNHNAFAAFKAPTQNGTYALTLKLLYNHQTPNANCSEGCLNYGEDSCRKYCVITEIKAPFAVGEEISAPAECYDSYYNCANAPIIQDWSAWSNCVNGQQSRSRILNCTYIGTNPQCERYRAITQTETQNCTVVIPCSESDYSCDEWQPALCSPQSTQTRTCQLTSTTCSPNVTGSTAPITERTCDRNIIIEYVQAQYSQGITRSQVQRALQQAGWSQSEIESILNHIYGVEEKPSVSGWIWIVIIATIIVVAVIVIIVFVMPKSKKGKSKTAGAAETSYPELISYIKDALATGATKAEITAKLQEAGWPKEAIEESFRAVSY
ncbi:MAG: hypothetical protein QW484_00075 [Candidatus Pacearchaeota archaeon]